MKSRSRLRLPTKSKKKTKMNEEGIKEKKNKDTCEECGEYGQLICCDGCTSAFHLNCLSPLDQVSVLQEDVNKSWFCPLCTSNRAVSPKLSSSITPNPCTNRSAKTHTLHSTLNDHSNDENSGSELESINTVQNGSLSVSKLSPLKINKVHVRALDSKETKKRTKKHESDGDDGSQVSDGHESSHDLTSALHKPVLSDTESNGTNEYIDIESLTFEVMRKEGNSEKEKNENKADVSKIDGIVSMETSGKRYHGPDEACLNQQKKKGEKGTKMHSKNKKEDRNKAVTSKVSGPRSALTSFLEEKGISARNIRQRHLAYIQSQRNEELENDSSISNDANQPQGGLIKKRIRESDDEMEEIYSEDISCNLKTKTKPNDEYAKVNPKKKAKKGYNRKKEKGEVSSDSDSDQGRPVIMCLTCGRQLPREQSMASVNPTHPQCELCIAAVEKRRVGQNKKKKKSQTKGAVLAELYREIPSLQNMCINMISNRINDVESFGDVPANVMTAICTIICRHRQLIPETVQLFLENEPDRLIFTDCAKLTAESLKNIAFCCPTLTTLRLEECGRMTDEVIDLIVQCCPLLCKVNLQGAYLVNDECWASMIHAFPKLEEFEIGWTPKLGTKTMEALSKLSNLKTVSFTRCSQLDDEILSPLSTVTTLKKFALHECSVTDALFQSMLPIAGASLTHLDVKGCSDLTDDFIQLVAQNCHLLEGLVFDDLQDITDEAVLLLTSGCPKITKLHMRGCVNLTDESVLPLLEAYGRKLEELTIACLENISPEIFQQIASGCHYCLTELDISWCRCVDDE
eukprot:Ihof_evm1s16 gene=Ihof_evmTU1s16